MTLFTVLEKPRKLKDRYVRAVLTTAPASLVAYWPFSEASGTTADNLEGTAARDGGYTDVTLGAAGIGDGRTAGSFNGTSSVVNIYSASFNTAFNHDEFSIVAWLKVASVDDWQDGDVRSGFRISTNTTNLAQVYKSSTNNTLVSEVRRTSAYTSTLSGMSTTDWMMLAITCSEAADKLYFYINGAQVGLPTTGFGAWAGVLSSTGCAVGSIASTGTVHWNGTIAHPAVWSTPLTITQIRNLARAGGSVSPSAVFFGDSITAGTGASDAAHRWVNLVAASQGYVTWANAGVGSSVLQNSAQNSVAVLGGAAANNGRDRVASAVNAYNPDKVFILYGLNDLRLNDAGFSVAAFQNDLGEVVDALTANGTAASNIVIGSPPYIPEASYALSAPWDGGSRLKHAAHTAACAAVASAKGTKYIDVYQWMTDNGGDTLISGDNIHPNDAGHAAIAAAFQSVL